MNFFQIPQQHNIDDGIPGSIHHFFDFLSINKALNSFLSQGSSSDTASEPTNYSSLNTLVPDKSLDFLDIFGNNSNDVEKVSASNPSDKNDAFWGDLNTSNIFTAINEFLSEIIKWTQDILESIKNAIHGDNQNPDDDLGDTVFQSGQIWMDDPDQGTPGEWDSGDFLVAEGFNGIFGDDSVKLGPDYVNAAYELLGLDLLNNDNSNKVVWSSSLPLVDISENSEQEFLGFEALDGSQNNELSVVIAQGTIENAPNKTEFGGINTGPQTNIFDTQGFEEDGLLIANNTIEQGSLLFIDGDINESVDFFF